MVIDSMKITGIEGGVGKVESEEFVLGNYGVAMFLFNNPNGNTATVKVKANTENGEAEYVPFKLRAGEIGGLEDVDAAGREVTEIGAIVATVTAHSLGRKECDRISVEITTDGEIATIFAILSLPRHSE